MAKVKLAVQNEEFATTSLTAEERALFEAQWEELFMPPWSLERQFINAKKDVVLQLSLIHI